MSIPESFTRFYWQVPDMTAETFVPVLVDRNRTTISFVQRLDGGTSMMPSLWKEMSTTHLTCAVLAELMQLDVITHSYRLPLHFTRSFSKSFSLPQPSSHTSLFKNLEMIKLKAMSHHVTHGNRLS